MLNLDVVSYHEEGVDDIGIYLDDGKVQIIRFIQMLTDEYLNYGWQNVNCGSVSYFFFRKVPVVGYFNHSLMIALQTWLF